MAGALGTVRAGDRWLRRRLSGRRKVLLDVCTPMNMAVMAPLVARFRSDARVKCYVTSSENPSDVEGAAGDRDPTLSPVHPHRAALMGFDACVVADLRWPRLLRGVPRVLMFHGVAGKYGHTYDAPTASMREWRRIFFINRRRLNNFIRAGAIDEHSEAARLVGYPKLDQLVDGTLQRADVLRTLGIDPAARTVLYAPTWTLHSSLNSLGENLVRALVADGYTVIVKLHDRSRDRRAEYSGGVDWVTRIRRALGDRGVLADSGDATPLLAAADVLVTDHSSVGFEYLLLDRPVVRIDVPMLIAQTNIDSSYVDLLRRASDSVTTVSEACAAVANAFANSRVRSDARVEVGRELFHDPGSATSRAMAELYALMELEAPAQPRG